jgi:hypothetical protein
MPRRKLIGAVAIGLVALAVGALLLKLSSRPNRVSLANYHCVRMGISQSEVIAILGPIGDYTTGPYERHLSSSGSLLGDKSILSEHAPGYETLPFPRSTLAWLCDEGEITVEFGPEGVVCRKVFWPVYPIGPIERAKRLWRKWFR